MADIDGRWVTMNGARVFISNKGDVIMGLGSSDKGGHMEFEDRDQMVAYISKTMGIPKKVADQEILDSISVYTEHPAYKDKKSAVTGKSVGNYIDEYIEAAPKYDGDMYRGMVVDAGTKFKVGDSMTSESITSWTSDRTIADNYAGMGGRNNVWDATGKQQVIVTLEGGSKNSTSISGFSRFNKEVIMHSGNELIISSVVEKSFKASGKYIHITVKEK